MIGRVVVYQRSHSCNQLPDLRIGDIDSPPYGGHQFVQPYDTVPMFEQICEAIEYEPRGTDEFAISPQLVTSKIQPEASEPILGSVGFRVRGGSHREGNLAPLFREGE